MGGTKPDNNFRGQNFSEMSKKSGLRPANQGGPKIEKKKSFFGIKNAKNFDIRHPIFFSLKIFNPPMRPKRHFALKRHFSNGNHSKNKNPKKSQNFQVVFQKKKVEKKIEKIIIFFSSAPAAPLFFFSIGK